MELFLRSTALILIAVIFGLLLKGQNQSFGMMLTLAACCLVLISTVSYLYPVLGLLERIRDMAGINANMLELLLKAAGIRLIARLAEMICKDGGQSALGNAISLMSNCVILWLSISLVEELLELIQEVLGKL